MPTEREKEHKRTVGRALGSGVSSVVTGYAAAPHLFADKGREFSMKALKASPGKHLRHIYGGSALKKGLILAGVSAAGGAISEAVQSRYEKKARTALPKCVKCGRAGGQYPIAVCKRCGYDGKPPKSANERLVQLAAGGASTIPPLTHLHPEKCIPIARQALISAGVIKAGSDFVQGFLDRCNRSDVAPSPEPRRFRGDGDGIVRFDVTPGFQRWKTAGAMAQAIRQKGRVGAVLKADLASKLEKTLRGRGYTGNNAYNISHSRVAGKAKKLEAMKTASSVVLFLYRRHPGELQKEPPRKEMKGPAKMLGHRLNPREVMRKDHRGAEDSWMQEHAEVLDLGTKPGLAATLQDVCGLREGQVVPRAQLLKLLREKQGARDGAVTKRRYAKIQGKPELGADAPHDLANFTKDLEALLENPDIRYVELGRK